MLCVLLLGVWGASLERVLGPTLKALAPKLQLLRLEPEALRSALLALPADEDDALILAASLRSKAAEHTLDALVDAVSVNPSGSYPDATLVSAFLGAIEPTYEGQYEEQQLVRAAASSLLRVDALLQRFADGLSPPTRARASAALSLSATEQQRVDDLPVLLSAALAPSVDEIRKKQPLWTEEQLEIVALDAIATELLDFGEGADWDEDELDDQHGAGWRGGGGSANWEVDEFGDDAEFLIEDDLLDELADADGGATPSGAAPTASPQTAPWSALTPDEQTAATLLGWKASSWDEGEDSGAGTRGWVLLSTEERAAAELLGYNAPAWDAELEPAAAAAAKAAEERKAAERRAEKRIAEQGTAEQQKELADEVPIAEQVESFVRWLGSVDAGEAQEWLDESTRLYPLDGKQWEDVEAAWQQATGAPLPDWIEVE